MKNMIIAIIAMKTINHMHIPVIVEVFLDFGDIDIEFDDACIELLYLAVEEQNIEIVILLLANDKIDVNIINKYYTENDESFDSSKSQLNPHKRTALHLAVEEKYVDIIKLLLDHNGIDTEVKDENGKKPIDYTSEENIIKLFNG